MRSEKNKGITLIALVITVIVLLILAGVAIATLTGDSGILNNAENAKEQTEVSNIKEEAYLAKSEAYIECQKRGEELTQEKLVEALNKYFKGSTVKGKIITTANGKYDIIVDSNSNIIVEKHEEKQVAKGDVELDCSVAAISDGKRIKLEIKLLGLPEWDGDELEKDFIENQFLVGKTTEELMVIAGKIKTEGTELTAEQVYNAMLKADVSTDTEEIEYEEFMENKDAIVQETYGYQSADLFAKILILDMAETNTGMNVGALAPYSKKVVPELVGKDENLIKNTVEGYFNNQVTFDEIVAEAYGIEGMTLDILEEQINAACYGTSLFSREEIMLVVAAKAYAGTHPIVIQYPDNSTENIDWNEESSLTFAKYYTVIEEGDYTFKVTGPSGKTEELVCTRAILKTAGAPIGDYVEYNVSYTDMYTSYGFTASNGWRILDGGTPNGDGTYSNVKLISTGIPAELYYYYDIESGTAAPSWWGTDTQVKELYGENYSTAGYVYDDGGYPNRYSASGLLKNFKTISFTAGTSATTNNGCFKKINSTDSGNITGSIFKATGASEVHNLTLEELNKARGLDETDTTSTKEADAVTGLFYLQNLEKENAEYGYTTSVYPWYWLASPITYSASNLRDVGSDGRIFNYGGDTNGVRPVVSLSSKIQKNASGNWEIVQ